MLTDLHLHTENSILDGMLRVPELIEHTKKNGNTSVGISDHGTLGGVFGFYKACKSANLNPIIGQEFYFTDSIKEKDKRRDHLCLFAIDESGYKNLVKLSSIGYIEGFYYKPRIDWELLKKYNEGLIATTACIGGVISSIISKGEEDRAIGEWEKFKEIFGDRLYFELMLHPNSGRFTSDLYNKELKVVDFALKYKLPCIITNDAHYLSREDFSAHEIFLCIQTKSKLKDEKRLSFDIPEFFCKTRSELREVFKKVLSEKSIDECFGRLDEIEKRCGVELKLDIKYPAFEDGDKEKNFQLLVSLCERGLKEKILEKNEETYRKRLEYELSIIRRLGFVDYLLIVHDYIEYAKKNSILVGPGRGSVCGSLICYLLEVTQIDPIKYNLLFSRFVNPDRVMTPDIDTDFQSSKRDLVKRYIIEKYKDVYTLGTNGTLRSRGVVRDVQRVLGLDESLVSSILFSLPQGVLDEKDATKEISLKEACNVSPALASIANKEKELFTILFRLEGLTRQVGVHAAGLVFLSGCSEFFPLRKSQEVIITQFSDKIVDDLSILKIDVLGLRMLDTISETLKLIGWENSDIYQVSLDDIKTWELICRGDTTGVFQLESSTMRDLMGKLQPRGVSELATIVALYRPGPYRSGMVEVYLKNKLSGSVSLHESLRPILGKTLGVVIFQEQIMEIAVRLADYTDGEADHLRKCIAKQLPEEMKAHRRKFTDNCLKKNIPQEVIDELFKQFESSAIYSFNASHATAYAFLAYITAYLKANYLLEFSSAFLNCECADEIEANTYLSEIKRSGIEISEADINYSREAYSIYKGKLVRGLSGIKYVGGIGSKEIIDKRGDGYRSYSDFISRVEKRKVNKRVINALLEHNCFSSIKESVPVANSLGIGGVVSKVFEEVGAKVGTLLYLAPSTNGEFMTKIKTVNGEMLDLVLSGVTSSLVGEKVVVKDKEVFPLNSVRGMELFANRVERCSKCSLKKRVVMGEGCIKNPIMYIGEAPGEEEDLQGSPFVGRAGKLLRECLGSKFLENAYMTNLCKCCPPNNRKPLKKEIEECISWLKCEIFILRPRLIVVLGGTALHGLIPDAGSTTSTFKKSLIYKQDGIEIKVVSVDHPSYILREGSEENKKEYTNNFLEILG